MTRAWHHPGPVSHELCENRHTTSPFVRWNTLTKTTHSGQAPVTTCSILWHEVLVRNTELTSHHQPEDSGKGWKETPCFLPTSQNSPHWHPSWLSNARATRKDPESERLAKDNPETSPITINPRLRATWQSSSPGFPDSAALHPGAPSQ